MTDFQPLLQKPEAPSDARAEFERGLEELMSGHLDDCDDLAESSATRRRQSRILSRWAARQAQEMITTTERRNRESDKA
ncbi:hypothetical protein GOBAR_DD21281 [Gossypium barbadense]|nr:hypothetical protein GOBAR_DD21281 [Gossypium barbadense]